MSENECIDILQYLLGYENAVDKGELDTPNNLNSQEKEALRMILEEIQQYREIGLTPTMVKDLIKSCKKHEKNALENVHIVDDYQAIGTVEEFKALKEKNEPKKPIKHGSYYVCPCCGNTEIEYCNEVDCRTIRLKRCTLCEQKLDWQ